MVYAKYFSTVQTPQKAPIPGKSMVKNNAGGYGFAVDDWVRLDRFLILGSEGGTYYASEPKLTWENAESVIKCIEDDGRRTVDRIVEISESGRAPKNNAAIFALTLCCSLGDDATKRYAFRVVSRVCRIGTHLFQFCENIKHLRGKGRGLRNALANWYTEKKPDQLAYQVIKYRNREGWTHRDVLRIAHPKTNDAVMNSVFKWCIDGEVTFAGEQLITPELIISHCLAQDVDKKKLGELIVEHKLPRESVPTEMLNHAEIWDALLQDMPMTAMIRNLGNMSKVGLLAPMSDASRMICDRLANEDYLKKARVHPLGILLALKTYAQGRGMRGSGEWRPVPQVVDALDEAFYKAFHYLEPTGKRWLLGIDVSGSMSTPMGGNPLKVSEGAAALAMTVMKTESQYYCHGFSHRFMDLGLSARMRLGDVLSRTEQMTMGGTDCALPMFYAFQQKIPVDVFVVLTDNETWYGNIHPCQALEQYRQKMGIAAKLIVVGMTSTGFSIADPADGGMMDCVGFDAALPSIMADFAR